MQIVRVLTLFMSVLLLFLTFEARSAESLTIDVSPKPPLVEPVIVAPCDPRVIKYEVKVIGSPTYLWETVTLSLHSGPSNYSFSPNPVGIGKSSTLTIDLGCVVSRPYYKYYNLEVRGTRSSNWIVSDRTELYIANFTVSATPDIKHVRALTNDTMQVNVNPYPSNYPPIPGTTRLSYKLTRALRGYCDIQSRFPSSYFKPTSLQETNGTATFHFKAPRLVGGYCIKFYGKYGNHYSNVSKSPWYRIYVSDLPEVSTGATDGLGPTGVSLLGSVNPLYSADTSTWFEWGETRLYGHTTNAQDIPMYKFEGVSISHRVEGLSPQTEYHYRIVARNGWGTVFGADRTFTTTAEPINSPPYIPNSPSPADGVTIQGLQVELRWNGGDPDHGDTVTYDVYFGTSLPPTLVSPDQLETTYDPGILQDNTTYYWKIVAKDSSSSISEGLEWNFTIDNIFIPQNLPQTGQTACYDESGNVIDCTDTGQDGDIRVGVAWPSPRFMGNDNGTVTDNLTGLMWLKDANCADTIGYDPDGTSDGSMKWQNALHFVSSINNATYPGCGAVYNDWRLPNANELESLIHAGFGEKACGGSPCSTNASWLNTKGFQNVQIEKYWSSTTLSNDANGAWIVNMMSGSMYAQHKYFDVNVSYVWPVRAGQQNSPDPNYPANLWKTGQTKSYAPGDDGYLQMGVHWPIPRFTDNGDGTVADNLTGLMWLKDANCFGNWNWQSALDAVVGFSTNPGNYNCQDYTTNYTDWRAPNRKELRSLIDYSQTSHALPSGHPFTKVHGFHNWSSTTSANDTDLAWFIFMENGHMGVFTKTAYFPVWPVRAGTFDSSLILSFLFEDNGGTTADSSGNGNDGIINGAIFTTGQGVGNSNAYQFDWSNQDNIEVPYQESQIATEELTLEAWIYPTAWDNIYAGYNRIISKQPVYLLRGANGHAHFQILTENHGYQGVYSGGMTLNQWHYVVGTFDGQYLNLYVDGILRGTTELPEEDGIVTNEAPIFVGESPVLNEGFTGIIDNVVIYKRAKLQHEVEETYASVDGDNDSVPNGKEMGPDGNDPTYDGNNDGTPDSQQVNVASLHSYDQLYYVTLSTPEGTTLNNVRAVDNPSPANVPHGVEFPYGFFEFTISGIGIGDATTVTLYLPDTGRFLNTYYKYGATPDNHIPHWYEFMYDGQTGAEINGNIVTLHFVDAKRGDDDLTADGTIIDQGGPGVLLYAKVPVDIKPRSCPNPINIKSRGVLPVAILGKKDFDVTQVDPASIILIGITPLRFNLEDVSRPFEPLSGKQDAFSCTSEGPDGFQDLTLKFDTQEVIKVIGEVENGEVKVLTMTGNLLEEFGGTQIEGEDVVVILNKGNRFYLQGMWPSLGRAHPFLIK